MADKKFLFLNDSQNTEEAAANSTLALGGLTMTGAIAMGSNQITGLASGTASTDAATFGQLQAAIAGLYWVDPAAVLRVKSDADQSGTPPTAGSTGEAWVVDNWGSGYNDGDIVEWDGDSWVVVVANSGAEPPNGTRVVVIEASAAGSFVGQEKAIATYSASGNTWSFDGPEDGTALIINGDGGYYADIGYTYNGTNWVQFQGTAAIVAGDGLDKAGNILSVKTGDGVTIVDDRVTANLTSNGGLQFTGTTPTKTLGVLVNTSAGMQLDGSGIGIDLSAAPGLEFSTGLQVKVSGSDGLIIDGSTGTLMLELDNTPDTLDVDADGLKVVGLPALFKINDVAVGADVTAANLDTLTDGSDADLLHTHAAYALTGHDHDGVYSPIGHDHDLVYAPIVHEHTGAGSVENSVTAHVALLLGDPVVQHSQNNEVNKADANTEDLAANILGVALTAADADAAVSVVCNGLALGVLGTSGVAGTRYYLAAGGGLTTTPPGTGKSIVLIGWAKNAADLWVEPRFLGKRA